MELLFTDPTPRRFILRRALDHSGFSGTGLVASGCVWPDNTTVLHWNTFIRSTTVFATMGDLEALHGHSGDSEIVWIDDLAEPLNAHDDILKAMR
jgi:hypothetical protein